ncbi:hypothetical protein BDK51DRAFT_33270, partial [Blyttiomyces helicus]
MQSDQQGHGSKRLMDPSTMSLSTDALFSKQLSSSSFFIEPIKDASDTTIDDILSRGMRSPGSVSGPPVYRRTRAETFSSFPSKFFHDDSPTITPPVRHRSGSLSLPGTDITSAFGPGLFATTWQPATSAPGSIKGSGGEGGGSGAGVAGKPISSSDYASSLGTEDDTNAVARTLDYLGLDDPAIDESPRRYASSRYPESPSTSPQYPSTRPRSGSTGSSPIATASGSRARSYSVAVGENLSITIPQDTAPSYRPRASSIAYLESTADNDILAFRRSLALADIDSVPSETRSESG